MLTSRSWTCAAVVVALCARAGAASLPFPGLFSPGGARMDKPHPAIAALHDYRATLHTNLGDLAIKFEPDHAPNAVRNFIKLAHRGFYDGSRFYCVFKDKMILAGDPTGKGTGDVGYALDYEASPLGHTPGTLAMDRRPDAREGGGTTRKNSGSRFLINVGKQHHLDRDYTVFARITDGLEVARRIGAAACRDHGGRPQPLEDMVIERITVEKTEPKKASSDPNQED